MFIAKKKPEIIKFPEDSPRPHIKCPFRIIVYLWGAGRKIPPVYPTEKRCLLQKGDLDRHLEPLHYNLGLIIFLVDKTHKFVHINFVTNLINSFSAFY